MMPPELAPGDTVQIVALESQTGRYSGYVVEASDTSWGLPSDYGGRVGVVRELRSHGSLGAVVELTDGTRVFIDVSQVIKLENL